MPFEAAAMPSGTVITADDPRWRAVRTRDAAADGRFFYSVKTTGVYCRPSCASRAANPKNVRFHATAAAAEAAGFRPCKRCKPDEAPAAAKRSASIARACRSIARAVAAGEPPPNLDALASAAKLSRYHFHRLFKAETGVTPRDYAAATRAERLRAALPAAASVTAALYDAGFNASSRFYEQADGLIGMTPSAYRQGGKDADIAFAIGRCSLGALLVAVTARGVCAIALGDDAAELERELRARFPKARLAPGGKSLARRLAQIVRLIEQPSRGLDLPLDVRGTAFQQRVWRALRDIPPGESASYAEIAKRIGAPKAARAVGSACGANAIAVVIPCHRAVRLDGSLSDYRWGVARKRALLEREAKKR
ncbi:MAG: bifunctional DNA-binding transcriptional regulator/O6-methylguanine-DNA methyltransferase Ada [Alphaproteobacteria bacterium]